MEEPDEQTISWEQLRSPMLFGAGKHHRRHVEPAIVPVVFVPGMMGTRLVSHDDSCVVWDPDFLIQFAHDHALKSAQSRRPQLFASRAKPTHQAHKLLGRFMPSAQLFGFEQLVQRFYGTFENSMRERLLGKAPLLHLCFQTPLYAAGYNWVDSPLAAAVEVADRLRTIVAWHRDRGDACPGIILVTHSMGGLIGRAAAQVFGGDLKILGMIHVGQPTLGAPAAYARMKAGNVPEDQGWLAGLAANVLGRTGVEATSLMARMPGALCLLPHVAWEKDWLTLDEYFAAPVELHADVVRHVYQDRDHFWGLADLDILTEDTSGAVGCFDDFLAATELARVFHAKLGTWHHPRTFHVVGTQVPTIERIEFSCSTLTPSLELQKCPKIPCTGMWRRHYSCGNFAAECHQSQGSKPQGWRAQMRWHLGDGDGTVPLCSALGGSGIDAAFERVVKIPGGRHDTLMGDDRVKDAVFAQICGFLRDHFLASSS